MWGPFPGTRLLSLAVSLSNPQGAFNSLCYLSSLRLREEAQGGMGTQIGTPNPMFCPAAAEQGPRQHGHQHPPCPSQLCLCLFNLLDRQGATPSAETRKGKSWFGPDVVSRPGGHSDLDRGLLQPRCYFHSPTHQLHPPAQRARRNKRVSEGREGPKEDVELRMSPRQYCTVPHTA